MSRDLYLFLKAALQVGLAPRLEELAVEVEQAIADYPPGPDRRYLARLEDQLDRLRNPDLPLVAAVVRNLCTQDPARLKVIMPIAAQLVPRHPCLVTLTRFEQAE